MNVEGFPRVFLLTARERIKGLREEIKNGPLKVNTNNYKILLSSLLFYLTLYGCVTIMSPYANLEPLKASFSPIEFPGFSLLPPQGDNWFIVSKDQYHEVFTKKLLKEQSKKAPHTVMASVGAVIGDKEFNNPEEFMKFIEEENKKDLGTLNKYKEAPLTAIDTSKGATCEV